MEKIENIIRERVLEGSFFFHNTKFVSFGWTKELYWRMVLGGLEDLYEFFKFNLCCYNIFKIKNILIININLSEIFLKFDQKKKYTLKALGWNNYSRTINLKKQDQWRLFVIFKSWRFLPMNVL